MYSFINFTQGTNFQLNLYCFLLYGFLLLISLKGNVTNLYIQKGNNTRTMLLAGGLLIFALSSFIGDDFFHYYEFMNEYRGHVYGDQERGLELFYQYLIYYINGNYFIFRLVVWGGSLALIVIATRLFGANVYHTLFVVLAGFIVTYAYARATLAMSVFSLGIVIICTANKHKKDIIKTIIGLFIVVCSIYFHRSMLPMILVTVGWLLLPWKKQLSKHSLWLFPIFVAIFATILKFAFEEILVAASSFEDETGMLERAEFYSEQEALEHNTNGYIRLFLHYSTYYLPLLLLSNTFRSNVVLQNVDERAIDLYQIVYITCVFATSFLFLDLESDTLFYRYLYMSFIPMSILLAYLRDIGAIKKNQYLWVVVFLILSNLFQLFVAVYKEL